MFCKKIKNFFVERWTKILKFFDNSFIEFAYERWMVVESNIDKYIPEYFEKEQKEDKDAFTEMFKFISFCFRYSSMLPGYAEDLTYTIDTLPQHLFYIYCRENNDQKIALMEDVIRSLPEMAKFFLSKKLDVYVDYYFNFCDLDVNFYLLPLKYLKLNHKKIKPTKIYGFCVFRPYDCPHDKEEEVLKKMNEYRFPVDELKTYRKYVRKPIFFPDFFIKYFNLIEENCFFDFYFYDNNRESNNL